MPIRGSCHTFSHICVHSPHTYTHSFWVAPNGNILKDLEIQLIPLLWLTLLLYANLNYRNPFPLPTTLPFPLQILQELATLQCPRAQKLLSTLRWPWLGFSTSQALNTWSQEKTIRWFLFKKLRVFFYWTNPSLYRVPLGDYKVCNRHPKPIIN